MKAHQDYAIVGLIARVPASFNKRVSSPYPFSLLTSAYILFIYLGFNTSLAIWRQEELVSASVQCLMQHSYSCTSARQKADGSDRPVWGLFLIVCVAEVKYLKYLRTCGTHQRTGICEDA